jgi:hypothetical protein
LEVPFRRWKTPRDGAAAAGAHQGSPGQKRSPLTGRVARSFGVKCAWLAIRSPEPEEVARTLHLEPVKSTAWPDGLAAVDAYPRKQSLQPVFVCPAVDGWVLCPFSLALASLEQFDLQQLSRQFGETQRFLTYGVTDLHQWERWVDGELVRRFGAEADVLLFETGEQPEEETQVRLSRPDAGTATPRMADEDMVLEIAGRWSVNPMTLDERTSLPVDGWLGGLNPR